MARSAPVQFLYCRIYSHFKKNRHAPKSWSSFFFETPMPVRSRTRSSWPRLGRRPCLPFFSLPRDYRIFRIRSLISARVFNQTCRLNSYGFVPFLEDPPSRKQYLPRVQKPLPPFQCFCRCWISALSRPPQPSGLEAQISSILLYLLLFFPNVVW